jgi:hypothetical protein
MVTGTRGGAFGDQGRGGLVEQGLAENKDERQRTSNFFGGCKRIETSMSITEDQIT